MLVARGGPPPLLPPVPSLPNVHTESIVSRCFPRLPSVDSPWVVLVSRFRQQSATRAPADATRPRNVRAVRSRPCYGAWWGSNVCHSVKPRTFETHNRHVSWPTECWVGRRRRLQAQRYRRPWPLAECRGAPVAPVAVTQHI